MTGKTHASIGIFSVLAVVAPVTVKEAAFCVGVAAIGSVICDVDVSKSDSRNKLNHIVLFMIAVGIGLVCLEKYWNVDLISYIRQDQNLYRMIGGALVFLCICLFGASTPHRSFMHSILGIGCISLATWMIEPDAVYVMAVAMCSHLLIDFLNHKKVRIFYPLKAGISFGICASDGKINDLMFLFGILGSGYILLHQLLHITL